MVFLVVASFIVVIGVATPIPIVVPGSVVIVPPLSLRGTTVVVAALGDHTGGKTKECCNQQGSSDSIEGIH